MMQPSGNHRHPAPSQEALRVLESFSMAAHVAFDRILAARAVGEAQRAIPGGDWSRAEGF
jgi:hypothetical protein